MTKRVVWLSWNDDASASRRKASARGLRRRLRRWSGKHKKHLEKPMTVYVIIFLLVVSYVSIINIGKMTGFATEPVAQTQARDEYTPPADLTVGNCGAPCPLEDGGIGVTTLDSQCLPIRQYYDEKHCCVNYDCAIGQECLKGVCGEKIIIDATPLDQSFPSDVKFRVLFVPVGWEKKDASLGDATAEKMANQQFNYFVNLVPLKECRGKAGYKVMNNIKIADITANPDELKKKVNEIISGENFDVIVGYIRCQYW
ncbi:MAG: hypothetical protein HZB67_02720 [Candidatus Aenigmarchaeota archaeon]|nr:hypothetical protein [Candidatus Aenigmarchaeota archaeon]